MFAPNKPDYLDDVAAEAWDRVVGELNSVGAKLLGKSDVLERYAVTFAAWRKCQAAIADEGQTVISHKLTGAVEQRNPRMVDLHQLTAALGRLRAELGLSPTKTKPGGASSPKEDQPKGIVYKFPR